MLEKKVKYRMKIVSACWLGINCNWAGKNSLNKRLFEEFKDGQLFPVCPEILAGMSIPRSRAEIRGGSGSDVLEGKARVINLADNDVTDQFINGAKNVLRIAEGIGAKEAILKAKSPSCGYGQQFDGTFSQTLTKGDGVTVALLRKNGIKIRREEELIVA